MPKPEFSDRFFNFLNFQVCQEIREREDLPGIVSEDKEAHLDQQVTHFIADYSIATCPITQSN